MKRSDFKDLNFKGFIEKLKFYGEHVKWSYSSKLPPQFLNLHYTLESVSEEFKCKIERFTLHKDRNITLYTDRGIIKFWHESAYQEEIDV